jgi:hypothetical protein
MINLSASEQEEILKNLPAQSKLKKKIESAGKTIKVRSAKAKGAKAQVDVCEFISDITGIPFLQGDDDSKIKPRPSGQNGVDVILAPEVRELFPYSVEVKNQENMNLVDTVLQARSNITKGTDWLVYHRRKALPEDIVILSADSFRILCIKALDSSKYI